MGNMKEYFQSAQEAIFKHWPTVDIAFSLPHGWIRPDSGHKRLGALSVADLRRIAAEMWARALKAGQGVHFRPAAQGGCWSYVLLDDLTPETARGVASKYAAVIIQTSHDSHQAVIATSRGLSRLEQHRVQAGLVRRLRDTGRSADPGATGAGQFGRMPGFPHPGHAGRVVRLVEAWCSGIKPLDPDLLLADAGQTDPMAATGEPSACSRPGVLAPATAGVGQGRKSGTADDESGREFGIACNAVRKGRDSESVIDEIADRALARGKYGKRCNPKDILKYAERTYAKAVQDVNSKRAC